jgi:hypothetical protein
LLKNYIKRGRSNLVTSCENRFGLARLLLATLGLLIYVLLNCQDKKGSYDDNLPALSPWKDGSGCHDEGWVRLPEPGD